jgi:dihydroorotate dehydrogenase
MNLPRRIVEESYSLLKPIIFKLTPDPEKAHEYFILLSNFLCNIEAEDFLFRHSDCNRTEIEISNAAGFNKNGNIPPSFLKALGFDRVVVGTVTADFWEGNPRPRIKRYAKEESLVNWMGLPGIGAERVRENLVAYGDYGIPLTISVMSTPGKDIGDSLKDIEKTTELMRGVPNVDRFELNISCLNTSSLEGRMDARQEHQENLSWMIGVVNSAKNTTQKLFVKISPDMELYFMEGTFKSLLEGGITGVVISNTTTDPDREIIPDYEKGGASGRAVYERALKAQKSFYEKNLREKSEMKIYEKILRESGMRIIACGGIDSREKMEERVACGASGVQVYTPLIFRGPKLLRELKKSGS